MDNFKNFQGKDDKILVRTRNGNELRDRVGNFLRKM